MEATESEILIYLIREFINEFSAVGASGASTHNISGYISSPEMKKARNKKKKKHLKN
jgi:hypothetical protein